MSSVFHLTSADSWTVCETGVCW